MLQLSVCDELTFFTTGTLGMASSYKKWTKKGFYRTDAILIIKRTVLKHWMELEPPMPVRENWSLKPSFLNILTRTASNTTAFVPVLWCLYATVLESYL